MRSASRWFHHADMSRVVLSFRLTKHIKLTDTWKVTGPFMTKSLPGSLRRWLTSHNTGVLDRANFTTRKFARPFLVMSFLILGLLSGRIRKLSSQKFCSTSYR
jgi:hypothetical protein